MPPLSRPRRRRWLLMNESPAGSFVASEAGEVDAVDDAVDPAVLSDTSESGLKTSTMHSEFLADCGVPEGFEIHITAGDRDEIRTIHLDAPFAFIGRDEECSIQLPGASIGRHHAYVQAVAGQFVVVDLNSRTGIRHNGKPVRTALLAADDTLEIGPYTLRVTCEVLSTGPAPTQESASYKRNPPIALAFLNQSRPVAPWTADTPITLIGSAKPSRIRLEHSSVSPQHCALIRGFDHWWIVDLASQSGTCVDDVPVSFRPLAVGTNLQIGRYKIAIRKPQPAEPVMRPPVFDDGIVQTPTLLSALPTTSTMPMQAENGASQQGNERLVVELFKEFAALHERTVSQLQQSFREMLEVATANNRPALPAAPMAMQLGPQETHPLAAAAPAREPVAEPETEEEPEGPRLTDLMQSEDPEERAAARELLAAQMQSLEAKLKGERDGIARRLMRSLSLSK